MIEIKGKVNTALCFAKEVELIQRKGGGFGKPTVNQWQVTFCITQR